MFKDYFFKLKELLSRVEIEEEEMINKAANKIAECIEKEGIVHVFGCGHSHILGEELFYRAGGLAPINPILIEDLMLHKGALKSSQLEKQNDLVKGLLSDTTINAGDVMIVASTSGRNPAPIDAADFARQKGAYVIAITSLMYSKNITSRHKSGKFLADFADLVIDNHINIGDTLMEHESLDVSFGSGSTVVGTAIVNGIMVEAINNLIADDYSPPIFKSGNADEVEEHNMKLIETYKERIPLLIK